MSAVLFDLEDVEVRRGEDGGFRLQIPKFVFRRGDRVLITGPSGCGKSTVLELLGLVLAPSAAGRFAFSPEARNYSIEGLWNQRRDSLLAELRRSFLAFILQTGGLFEFLSVKENIALGAQIRGVSSKEAEKRTKALMETLRIAHLQSHKPSSLSLGERQRTAIARAVASGAPVLLADEPTASLDPALSEEVLALFLQTAEQAGSSLILVSHDLIPSEKLGLKHLPLQVRNENGAFTGILPEVQ